MINVVAQRTMSEWQIESIIANLGETTYEINPSLSAEAGGYSGGTGTGGIDPNVYTRDGSTCPSSHQCVPVGNNGMYVRDTTNNRIYFSDAGYDRAINGANVDWAGVARDLLAILSGVGGSVNLSVWGIIWMHAGLASWGINFFITNE